MATVCRERSDFTQAEREVEQHPDHVVKVRGKVLMSERHYESMQETLEILRDEGMMHKIRRGIDQMRSGQTVPWRELKKQL